MIKYLEMHESNRRFTIPNLIAGASPFIGLALYDLRPAVVWNSPVLNTPLPLTDLTLIRIMGIGLFVVVVFGALVASLLIGFHRSQKVADAALFFLVGWGSGLLWIALRQLIF